LAAYPLTSKDIAEEVDETVEDVNSEVNEIPEKSPNEVQESVPNEFPNKVTDEVTEKKSHKQPLRKEGSKSDDISDIKKTFEGVVKAREMIDVKEPNTTDASEVDYSQVDEASTPPPPATKPRAKTQKLYPSSYPIKVQVDRDEVEVEKERIKMELERKDRERERESRMNIIINQQQKMKAMVQSVRGDIKTTATIDSLETKLITSYCTALESLQAQHKLLHDLKAATRGHQVELRKFQKNLKEERSVLKGRMMEAEGAKDVDAKVTPDKKKKKKQEIDGTTAESRSAAHIAGHVSPPPPPTLMAGTEKTNGNHAIIYDEQSRTKFSMQYNRSHSLPVARRDTFNSSHSLNSKRATMKELTAGAVKTSSPKPVMKLPPPPPKRLGIDKSFNHKGDVQNVKRVSFTLGLKKS